MFEKVSTDLKFVDREQEVLAFWKDRRIFEQATVRNAGKEPFTFYDGPPTANGKPHIGHILTRVIKDIIPRHRAMKGFDVLRKAGWDTHGLPVELEVEKALGINGKPQIEAYGVGPFIARCRESVWKYKEEWERMSERVGFWADMEDPYVTYDNDYIESEWWALRQIWDRGLLYPGHKVVPYCPRCGTALSSHEVAQGYQDVRDMSVYVRFRSADEPDTWFASWTTTPWTLPSNVALVVNADEEYVLAEFDRDPVTGSGPARYYLAGVLLPQVFDEPARIVARMRGADLVGKRYEALFPFADAIIAASGKTAWRVVADPYVTLTDGTGIVHTAPAFGEDDARVGRNYDLPFVQLVAEDGTMSAETGEFAGHFCKDADAGLTRRLDEEGKLIRTQSYEHSYPFCWRCDTPLIYYARHSWFIRMSALRDRLMANNATVNWLPESIRDGRFGNFLENVIDWGISRERYWGTPLPIWICGSCDHHHLVGSVAELREMALESPAEIELHKPQIDAIRLRCPRCGGTMERVSEVIDCWFDSGSMPFAQWHYPFENQEVFERRFPADFISEALDQTRGWFYTLMAISTLLFDVSPFKNCIVLGLVQDKNGQKMSKHKGNVVDPWDVLDRQGADAVRWYFYTNSAPWLPSRFSQEAVSEAQRRFLGTFWNTYAFFVLYARIDGFDPSRWSLVADPLNASSPAETDARQTLPGNAAPATTRIGRADLSELDRWVLSRLHSLIGTVDDGLDRYDITGAARAIQDFIDELSNWYVRRSRERFWQSEMNGDKIAAYLTLYTVLETLSRLTAPFIPFMADAMYRNLVCPFWADAPESVHLSAFPVASSAWIDGELERNMADTMRLVVLGRAARNTAAIKNRQPLAELFAVAPRRLSSEFEALITEELNVRRVTWMDSADDLVDYRFKPQLRTLGRRFGSRLPLVSEALRALDGRSAKAALDSCGYLLLDIGGTEEKLAVEDVLIDQIQPEGLTSERDRDWVVALDTLLTPELIEEGFVREIVSKVQTMRKEADFDVTDRIVLSHSGNPRIAAIIERNRDRIAEEVLAAAIDSATAEDGRDWLLNGEAVRLAVRRVVV